MGLSADGLLTQIVGCLRYPILGFCIVGCADEGVPNNDFNQRSSTSPVQGIQLPLAAADGEPENDLSELLSFYLSVCVETAGHADAVVALLADLGWEKAPRSQSDAILSGVVPYDRALFFEDEQADTRMVLIGYSGNISEEARRLNSSGIRAETDPIRVDQPLVDLLGTVPNLAIGTRSCRVIEQVPDLNNLVSEVESVTINGSPLGEASLSYSSAGKGSWSDYTQIVYSWNVDDEILVNIVYSTDSPRRSDFVEVSFGNFVLQTDSKSSFLTK
ncbi:MAG: hypothetical protein AAF768_10235 [Pseudomonadota bacterium]